VAVPGLLGREDLGPGGIEHFTTQAQARARVATWIEDYHTTRRHTALACAAPSSTAGVPPPPRTPHVREQGRISMKALGL
jgi:hypothetical protein